MIIRLMLILNLGAELEVWRGTQEGIPAVIINPGVILGTGVKGNPLEILCNQIDNRLRFFPKGATGYVTVEDVVDVLVYLMNSEIKKRTIYSCCGKLEL